MTTELDHLTFEEKCDCCDFARKVDDKYYPTVLGILFLCSEPHKYIPCAETLMYIDGKGTTRFIGPINEQIVQISDLLKDMYKSDFSEIVVNAFLHRAYWHDRPNTITCKGGYDVKIESYPGPVNCKTWIIADFNRLKIDSCAPERRNPKIFRVLKDYNLAHGIWIGISSSRKEFFEFRITADIDSTTVGVIV